MAISESLRELYLGNSYNQTLIQTISISHSLFENEYHFCNYFTDITCKLEDETSQNFVPNFFKVEIPTQKNSVNRELQVTLLNTSITPLKEINNIITQNSTEEIQIILRYYLDGNFDTPAYTVPFEISVFDVSLDRDSITLQGEIFKTMGKDFPRKKYFTSIFPGLNY